MDKEESVDISEQVFGKTFEERTSVAPHNEEGKAFVGALPISLRTARPRFFNHGYRSVVEAWELSTDMDALLKAPKFLPVTSLDDLVLKLRHSSRFHMFPDDLLKVVAENHWVNPEHRSARWGNDTVYVLKYPLYTGTSSERAAELSHKFGLVEIASGLDHPEVQFEHGADRMPWVGNTFIIRREYGFLVEPVSPKRHHRLAARRANRKPTKEELEQEAQTAINICFDMHHRMCDKVLHKVCDHLGLFSHGSYVKRWADILVRLESRIRGFRKLTKSWQLPVPEDLFGEPLLKATKAWTDFPDMQRAYPEFPGLVFAVAKIYRLKLPKTLPPLFVQAGQVTWETAWKKMDEPPTEAPKEETNE